MPGAAVARRYAGLMPRRPRGHLPDLRARRRARVAARVIPLRAEAPAHPEVTGLPDLDDDEAWLVLADLWQAQDDPRGLVVALNHAWGAATHEARPAVERALAAVVAAHAEALVGPDLAPHLAERGGSVAVTWSRCWIAAARCTLRPPGRLPTVDAAISALATAVPRHQTVRLQLHAEADGGVPQLEPTAQAIDRWPWPHLDALTIGPHADPGSLRVGDLSPWLRPPTLRHLFVEGSGILYDGALRHPRLEHLTLRTTAVWDRLAQALARADLPRLRVLELVVREPDVGAGREWVDAFLDRLPPLQSQRVVLGDVVWTGSSPSEGR